MAEHLLDGVASLCFSRFESQMQLVAAREEGEEEEEEELQRQEQEEVKEE